MVVKSDQERVRALLTEAISVLCKSGLNYKTEFSIEGLLGITVDSDDIFLVSIKETILREDIEPELPPKDDKPVNSTKRRARHRKSTPRHRQVVLSAESNDYQSDMWTLSPMADSSIQEDFQNCEVGSTASLDSKRNTLSREGTPHSHGSSPCHTSPSSPKDEPHRDITPQKRKQCNDIHLFSTSKHLDPNPSLSQNSTHETLVIKHEQDLDYEVNVMDTSETDLHLYPMTKKAHLETTAYDLSVSAALPSLTGLLSGQGPRPGCSAWQASLAGGRSPAASQTQSSVTAATLFSQPPQAAYVCPLCGRRMQHLGGWTRHVERCGTPRHCHLCGKQFKTSNSLRVHRFHYHKPRQTGSTSQLRTDLQAQTKPEVVLATLSSNSQMCSASPQSDSTSPNI